MKRRDVSRSVIRFGVFEFDPQGGELRKHGLKIKLEPQATKVLVLRLERPGQMCTREELQHQLWPDNVFVDFERSLYKVIHNGSQSPRRLRRNSPLHRNPGGRWIPLYPDCTRTERSGCAAKKRAQNRLPGSAAFRQ